MIKMLFGWLKQLVGGFFAEAFLGAGIALVSYAALSTLVTSMLDAAADSFAGLPGDMADVLALGGFGEVLSIIGAGILTRLAINSATLGIKKKAG